MKVQLLRRAYCSRSRDIDNIAPFTLDIAEKFIRYYWKHATPYAGSGEHGPLVLRQNTGNQAAVITRIASVQEHLGHSLAKARRDSATWRSLRSEIAQIIRSMPLWKLQTVGGTPHEFLYTHETYSHGSIQLEPGVAECFRLFYDLVRNLAQVSWMNRVRSLEANRSVIGENVDLGEFLFGSERQDLSRYRDILEELQSGHCFYCGSPVRDDAVVDHFIPWSRYPNDLGHNFVLADARCNGHKSDYLAAEGHLERWLLRNEDHRDSLAELFTDIGAAHDLTSSISVAEWAYEQDERARAQVWLRGRDLELLGPSWRELFGRPALEYLAAAEPSGDHELENGE